jgi:hypothetical protein
MSASAVPSVPYPFLLHFMSVTTSSSSSYSSSSFSIDDDDDDDEDNEHPFASVLIELAAQQLFSLTGLLSSASQSAAFSSAGL